MGEREGSKMMKVMMRKGDWRWRRWREGREMRRIDMGVEMMEMKKKIKMASKGRVTMLLMARERAAWKAPGS